MSRWVNYLVWEGLPWLCACAITLILEVYGKADALQFLLPATNHAAEVLRERLLLDLFLSQTAATLLLLALRFLWPYAVVRRPWPFLKNCIIDPLLGATVLVFMSYGWTILGVGPHAIRLLEEGKVLPPEVLPVFY